MKLTDKQKLEMKTRHLAQSELQSISRSGLIASVWALYPETAVDDGLGLLVYFNRLEQQGFLVIFISKISVFLFLINLKPTWHIFIVLMKFEVWYSERRIRETKNTEKIFRKEMVYSSDIYLHHEDFPSFIHNSWFSRYLILFFSNWIIRTSDCSLSKPCSNDRKSSLNISYGENTHAIPMYDG